MTRDESIEAYWRWRLGTWLAAEQGRGWSAYKTDDAWTVALREQIELSSGGGQGATLAAALHAALHSVGAAPAPSLD